MDGDDELRQRRKLGYVHEFEGGTEGFGQGAHRESAEVLSGLGKGSTAPESRTNAGGSEEEEDGDPMM